MFRPRVMPVLLLKNKGLVKSIRFKQHKYIGDPINAVRIFNDLKADELVFLDIAASLEKRTIDKDLVTTIGQHANMPFAVGGGITDLEQIRALLKAGSEKVVINTQAVLRPGFIHDASEEFGSSTIMVCMDIRKRVFGRKCPWILGGTKAVKYDPVDFAQLMEQKGAGELIVQSIDRDGSMDGYDIDLLKSISEAVSIPVVALGGAGQLSHLEEAYKDAKVNALAAGSLFVYKNKDRGVLINYPEKKEMNNLTTL